MIALICTLEPYRIEWLPQIVGHYREIGVQRFLFSLHLDPRAPRDASERDDARFRETLASVGVDEAWRWEQEYDAPSMDHHQRTLQSGHLRPDDWIVWCDSDEFQIYPAPLPAVVAQCEADGVDFLRGVFIDRVAADYGLPPFDPTVRLWDAFPRTCNVTAALAGGDPRKVVLARANVKLSGGKHYPVASSRNLKTINGWVQVHHFKWDATVLERLRGRVRPEYRAKIPWWTESQRLLDYFAAHGSRFDPADIVPIALEGAQLIAFE